MKNRLPSFLKVVLVLTLLIGPKTIQAQVDSSKFQKVFEAIEAPIPTTQGKIDSISRYSYDDWPSYSFEEQVYFRLIIQEEVESSLSLQSEYLWNRLLLSFESKTNNIGQSTILFDRNAEIAREIQDTTKLVESLLELCYLYYKSSLYDQCLEVKNDLVEELESCSDSILVSSTYGSVGWILTNVAWYHKNDSLQSEAVDYMWKAHDYKLRNREGHFNESGIVFCYTLARVKLRDRAISIAQDMINNYTDKSSGYYGRFLDAIVDNYIGLGMEDSTFFYLDKRISWQQEYFPVSPETDRIELKPNVFMRPDQLYLYVIACKRFNRHREVVKIIDQILYSDEIKPSEGLEIAYCQYGAESYRAVGEFKKASECQQKYIAYSDSVFVAEKETLKHDAKQASNAQFHVERAKAKELEEQQQLLIEQEKKTNRIITASFGIGSGGLLIFFFLLYRRYKKSQNQKRIIEEQKVEVDRAYETLEEQNLEIIDSINYAKRIQEAYLPHPDLLQQLIPTSFLLFKPKDLVSGDFYWFYTPNPDDADGDVFVVAADCTGHGVPGAIMSVVCCNAINKVVVNNKKRNTANILDEVREEVIQILTTKGDNQRKDGMDIAFARMNKKTGVVQFSGAHNPIWVLKNGAEEIFEVKGDKQPIGMFEKMTPFNEHEIQLEKGDSFYLFSDGFADQFGGEKGKKFKTANFKRLLLSIQDKSMVEQKVLLNEAFENWRGSIEQLDDVCVIGVRF